MEKKLRGALFGYKKRDVSGYIDALVADYERAIAEAKDEVSEFKKQNQVLMAENAEYFKKVESLEAEREYVSQAVISAEMRAKKVIEDAEKEAATLKANKAAEVALADEELERLKEQIKTLKLSAVATLRKYEKQMDDIVN